MHAPNTLPSLAQRSGISSERAQALWREATRAAARETQCIGTPAFRDAAVKRLEELMEAEARSRHFLHYLVRVQSLWATVPLETWGGLALVGWNVWRNLLAPAQQDDGRQARRA